jgi:tRNA(Ile)-lysidine synthase
MLDADLVPLLKGGKNLLAFSGGVDSTALFFLLLRENIPFDIAHVNYHTRGQSDAEASYAKRLAEEHGKACFTCDAEAIERNFEAEARRIRYDFFESLIDTHGYDTLLTAHQLDDRLEWLLMQLCKGAGLPELLGMHPLSDRETHTLARPLLGCSKSQLRAWLVQEGLAFYEDDSNRDERFLRNRFRQRYAEPLLETYRAGIERSLRYLTEDADTLTGKSTPRIDGEILMLDTPDDRLALMRTVDQWLKRHGYLMRSGEKERLKTENEVIIGRRYALSITETCTVLAPAVETTMPKAFRETCRRLRIGPGVRPYLYNNPAIFDALKARLPA